MLFSVIVPVYNRPDEIDELLQSLCRQTETSFEVLVIDDGSDRPCRQIVDRYQDRLKVRYFFKENSGQGFTRNYGFDMASGDYLVVFDSDCIIPPHYFETVRKELEKEPFDAWGGPDRSHPDFSPLQKAISYSMTSPFTTGGIRGDKNHIGTFYPRSFNMGISSQVYRRTGGFKFTRMGEDLEFSIRIIKSGFKVRLIEEAYVYHKRRPSLWQFFRQIYSFGRTRIQLNRYHPGQVKMIHMLPVLAVLYLLVAIAWLPAQSTLSWILMVPIAAYGLLIWNHSYMRENSLYVALLSVIATLIQITAYACGFVRELIKPSPREDE